MGTPDIRVYDFDLFQLPVSPTPSLVEILKRPVELLTPEGMGDYVFSVSDGSIFAILRYVDASQTIEIVGQTRLDFGEHEFVRRAWADSDAGHASFMSIRLDPLAGNTAPYSIGGSQLARFSVNPFRLDTRESFFEERCCDDAILLRETGEYLLANFREGVVSILSLERGLRTSVRIPGGIFSVAPVATGKRVVVLNRSNHLLELDPQTEFLSDLGMVPKPKGCLGLGPKAGE